MSQWRLAVLLFTPSWLSFGVVAAATALTIGVTNWSYFTYNSTFYDFFYGERGVITTLELAPGAVENAQHDISGNTYLYGIGVIFLAVLAAIGMFFVIRSAERGAQAARRLGGSINKSDYMQHAVQRLLIAGLWVLYILLTLNVLLPTSLLFSRIGAEDITSIGGSATAATGMLLLAVSLHGHIVFARLLCLRPRVFGGQAAIEGAMIR